MKKQTAVEWLFEQVANIDWRNLQGEEKIKILEQAKEMEKEQQMKTYEVALMRGTSYDEDVYHEKKWGDSEKYYNETFKQQEQ